MTGLPSGGPFSYLVDRFLIYWLMNVSHLFYDSQSSVRLIFAVIKIKFFGKLFVIILNNIMIYIVFIYLEFTSFCVS